MKQVTIFDVIAAPTPTQLGQMAAEAAANHAERESPGWKDLAFDAFVRYAKLAAPNEFITKNAREHAERVWGVPLPPDPRAWGHIATRARVEGVVRFIKKIEAPHVHGGKVSVWTLERGGE